MRIRAWNFSDSLVRRDLVLLLMDNDPDAETDIDAECAERGELGSGVVIAGSVLLLAAAHDGAGCVSSTFEIRVYVFFIV